MNNLDVYDLSDEALVKAVVDLQGRNLSLTDFEKDFVSGLADFWVQKGAITWRQRRTARRLLIALIARAERAKTVRSV